MTVPASPTAIGITAGNNQVTLNWTAPTDNGGTAITDYQIEYRTNPDGQWTTFADGVSTNTTITITGLTNGTSYDFRVRAVNSVGAGTNSDIVNAVPVTDISPTPTGISPTPTGVSPTPTPIRIGATDINTLIGGAFDVGTTTELGTTRVTVNNDVYISIGSGSSSTTIILDTDTQINESNNGSFNPNLISANNLNRSNVSNLTTGFVAEVLMQWGIPGTTLTFTKPVVIDMYIGTEYNGQTLNILRSPSVSSGWTSDGLVSTTCLVSSGFCTFSTNKASYFTVVSYQVPTNNNSSSNNSSSSSSQSSGNNYFCNDQAAPDNPDLFEIKANKGKVNLIYSPASKATSYAILYGLKKGDERFGAIIPTINSNQGIQNGDIFMLNPKTTYYFKVAAINGCNISPWSEWVSIKADKKKTVYKYMVVIKNKIKTLVSRFK